MEDASRVTSEERQRVEEICAGESMQLIARGVGVNARVFVAFSGDLPSAFTFGAHAGEAGFFVLSLVRFCAQGPPHATRMCFRRSVNKSVSFMLRQEPQTRAKVIAHNEGLALFVRRVFQGHPGPFRAHEVTLPSDGFIIKRYKFGRRVRVKRVQLLDSCGEDGALADGLADFSAFVEEASAISSKPRLSLEACDALERLLEAEEDFF